MTSMGVVGLKMRVKEPEVEGERVPYGRLGENSMRCSINGQYVRVRSSVNGHRV